jgi:hypothetical protein
VRLVELHEISFNRILSHGAEQRAWTLAFQIVAALDFHRVTAQFHFPPLEYSY